MLIHKNNRPPEVGRKAGLIHISFGPHAWFGYFLNHMHKISDHQFYIINTSVFIKSGWCKFKDLLIIFPVGIDLRCILMVNGLKCVFLPDFEIQFGEIARPEEASSKKEKTNKEELLHNRSFLMYYSPKMTNTIIIIMGELLNGDYDLLCGIIYCLSLPFGI